MSHKMQQIAVLSGKGGTGKTSFLGSFAALASDAVLADCDVDAPNLHLLLAPELGPQQEFRGAKVVARDEQRCNQCGACGEHCRFGAITADAIDPFACEGCGFCVLVCPEGALALESVVNGHYFLSRTRYGPMAHARLLPGAESSGRLVTMVRALAEETALEGGHELVLIDGPPGIGCTAVAAMAEVDLAVIVTEPTLSGISDMERVVGLAGHFGVPVAVIINKADLSAANTAQVRGFCAAHSIPVLGEAPFDDSFPEAVGARTPLVEYSDGPAAQAVRTAWERVRHLLAARMAASSLA